MEDQSKGSARRSSRRLSLSRLSLFGVAFSLAQAALAQATPRPAAGASPPRSAIVIVLDDVGAYDLQLYGGPVPTPNLEALAARGVRFDRAFANPTCSVTRRSLLFGHWATIDSGPPCSPAVGRSPTLDDYCVARRVTQLPILAGKWHLGGSPLGGDDATAPLDHGFFHWIAGSQANLNDCGGSNYSSWTKVEDGVVFSSSAYQPKALRDRVKFWWQSVAGGKLFVVNFAFAHGPMHRPPDDLLPAGYPPTNSARQRYEAMIVAADAIVGQVLEVVADDVLVAVIGDNGTPINVSPDPERSKTTTFERGIRVPLILAGGEVAEPGRVSSELVHAVDLYVTLIAWLGGSLPTKPLHPIASVSLLPSLIDPQTHAYHEYILSGNAWGNPGGDRCARSAGYKLRQLDDDGDDVPDREEFYDLTLDPSELLNRIGDPSLASVIDAHRAWLLTSAP
jgi:arylsulfatase B